VALALYPVDGAQRRGIQALGKLQGARLDNAGLQEPSCEGDKLSLGLVVAQVNQDQQALLAALGCASSDSGKVIS
jgi:hypothetical protein